MNKDKIRDAAIVILVRNPSDNPSVLMGQRGAKAAFMPNKFVFPGGAVDPDDAIVPLIDPLNATCSNRLEEATPALASAAIRELWEETGLILGEQASWSDPAPRDWSSFAATGHRPTAKHLHFVFRAITPPNRPRRFDARFFLADAAHIASDLDDFSNMTDELSHLQWIPIPQAREFDLPFITEVVLAEIAAVLPVISSPDTVPFFKNSDEENLFLRINGRQTT